MIQDIKVLLCTVGVVPMVVLTLVYVISVYPDKLENAIKRHLEWTANANTAANITTNDQRIDYLKPHPRNIAATNTSSSAIYMAFTLYKRNNSWIERNTGMLKRPWNLNPSNPTVLLQDWVFIGVKTLIHAIFAVHS